MSKRRKKSRFVKTDVNAICEMQSKICAYENYIVAMAGMIQRKFGLQNEPILMLTGTPMDDWMNLSWNGLRELKLELKELKEKKDGKTELG